MMVDKIREVVKNTKSTSHWENNKAYLEHAIGLNQYNPMRFMVCMSIIAGYFFSQSGWSKTIYDVGFYEFCWFVVFIGVILEITLRTGILKLPKLFGNIEYAKGVKLNSYLFIEHLKMSWIFWFIIVFIRAFIIDYYYIPSQSMLPNYDVGDKVVSLKVIPQTIMNAKIERGDVILFNFLPDEPNNKEKVVYIKRAVAIAGDEIEVTPHYLKVYSENKEIFTTEYKGSLNDVHEYRQVSQDSVFSAKVQSDWVKGLKIKENGYSIIFDNVGLTNMEKGNQTPFPMNYFKNGDKYCNSFELGSSYLKCTVPENHIFAIGDNRTASFDSRYWGFVNNKDIIGKANYSF